MARKAGTSERSSTPMATTLVLPKGKDLAALADTKRIQGKKAASATGVYRQRLGEMVEKGQLDKKAWAIAVGLHEIEDEETLHATYFHLLHYMDELGVTKRATAQEEMFDAGETGPGPNAKNGKGDHADDGEVPKHMGGAVREVAEKAGASLKG